MRHAFLRLSLTGLLATLALAACHNKDKEQVQQPGGDTPVAAVEQSVTLLKTGDFAGFWKHALPAGDYETLRTDWTRVPPDQEPLTDEERQEFQEHIKELTEPGAEDKLFAAAKPKLIEYQRQYSDQLPLMVGIFQGIARTGIDKSKDMSAAQKKQASDILDVLAPWAQQASWFDQVKARQAIGIVVGTARKLDLKSADAMRAMDFDTAMQKYSVGYLGLKDLLNVYGLSINATLDSVKVSTVETGPNWARVKIDYTLQGKPISTESVLIEQDGRWYSEDLLHNVRDSHERLMAPPSASTAGVAADAAAPAQAPAKPQAKAAAPDTATQPKPTKKG